MTSAHAPPPMVRPALVALAAAALAGGPLAGCADPAPPAGSPTPLYDAARRVEAAAGPDAAAPVYAEAAARGTGYASVVLWDHYGRSGDSARAAVHRAAALAALGDEAWAHWAFRPQGDDDDANVASVAARLRVGIGAGSAAAAEEMGRLVGLLEQEAASGNGAAVQALRAVGGPAGGQATG